MEYQVIARKWRPLKFADVVGQGHITRTLSNAIVQGRTAHAYLFVGPRGIGKTSSARIFAKALNCTSPVEGEPCCQCASCLSIADNNCLDIIEIDAASNNSVQSMRDLCDEVMYAPVSSKYKIYIIDEVHMLTAASWNALLKTVEEPPAHVKFIFATTEVHKVLPTILSRCQRFDLRRIPSSMISERLRLICDTESVPVSDSAISAIARAADGGMRDAQSLLDQMISFFSASEDHEISEDQVLSLFGLTASVEMEALVQAILTNNCGAVVTNIFHLAEKGKDLEKLLEELLAFFRGIQICQILPDPSTVLESGAESIEQYTRLAQLGGHGVVQRLLEVLSSVGYTLHNALNKQVYLETIILKAMRIAHAMQADDIIARLNQIRKNGEVAALDRVPMNTPVMPAPLPVAQPVQSAAPQVQTPVAQPVQNVEVQPVAQPAAPAPIVQPEPVIEQAAPQGQNVQEQTYSQPVQADVYNAREVEQDSPPWKADDLVEENPAVVEEPVQAPVVEQIAPPVQAPVVEQPISQPEPTPAPTPKPIIPVGNLSATIPSVEEVPVRDDSHDNESPIVIPDETISFSEQEEEIATYEAPVQEASPAEQKEEYTFVDYDSIGDDADASGHFDEVEHMNQLREKAKTNPLVSNAIELFDGEIVDVHEAKKNKEDL